MGRPRKPTKVLELRGSFDKDPQRRKAREREPHVDTPLEPAPATLNEAEQARYEWIRTHCTWLVSTDGPLVERTARIWMRLRDGNEKHGDEKQFTTNLSKLGMTPIDRSRVVAPEAKPKSKVEKYAS